MLTGANYVEQSKCAVLCLYPTSAAASESLPTAHLFLGVTERAGKVHTAYGSTCGGVGDEVFLVAD